MGTEGIRPKPRISATAIISVCLAALGGAWLLFSLLGANLSSRDGETAPRPDETSVAHIVQATYAAGATPTPMMTASPPAMATQPGGKERTATAQAAATTEALRTEATVSALVQATLVALVGSSDRQAESPVDLATLGNGVMGIAGLFFGVLGMTKGKAQKGLAIGGVVFNSLFLVLTALQILAS